MSPATIFQIHLVLGYVPWLLCLVSVRRHCESFESVTGWWDGGLKRASQL